MISTKTSDKSDKDEKNSGKARKKAERFLFDRHFFDETENYIEEVEVIEEEEMPEPPPTYSEEQLQDAVRKAREEGFKDGKQQAGEDYAQSHEKNVHKALESLATKLDQLITAEKQRDERFEQDSLRMLKASIDRLFPHFSDREGLGEIEHFAKTLIQKQKKDDEITVFVSGDMVDSLQNHIMDHQELSGYLIRVKVDSNLNSADCRIEWSNGGAFKDTTRLKKDIDDIIHANCAPEPGETGTQDKDLGGDGENQETNEQPGAHENKTQPVKTSEKTGADEFDRAGEADESVKTDGTKTDLQNSPEKSPEKKQEKSTEKSLEKSQNARKQAQKKTGNNDESTKKIREITTEGNQKPKKGED